MTARLRSPSELALGLALLLLACVFAYEAAGMDVAPIYAKVGPAAFLWGEAGGLGLCAILLCIGAFTGEPREKEPEDLRAPGLICLGLVISAFLYERGGFILSSLILFWLTARGMGSKSPWRDLGIGFVLSLCCYVIFSYGLDLRLPKGDWLP